MTTGARSTFLNARSPMMYVAILRIMMGLLFLETAWENAHKGLYGAGYKIFVSGLATGDPIHWYRSFVEAVVLPHWQAFAALQSVAEPAIGIMLILGLFTPLPAIGGAFLLGNIFLASWGREWPWTYINMIVMMLIIAASGSGRCLGLDYFLSRQMPVLGRLLGGLSALNRTGKHETLAP